MKKIISLFLCLALGGSALAGCSQESAPFTQTEYTADAAQIEEINIDVRDRQIEVSLSEDGKIHIIYFENSRETCDITVSDEKVLTMTDAGSKSWTDYIGGKPPAENRKISLQIPDAFLDTLALSTTNENISIPSLAVTGSISLSSNGGNITFDSLDVGDTLLLTVKNGDISGTVKGSYDDFAIQTEIKKGESSLPDRKEGGDKTLQVSCNHGDVNVEFVK